MRILVSLALALLVLAALVIGITFAAAAIAGSAGRAFDEGPMKSGFVPRISYILLWVLIFGTSLGLLGAE